MKLELTKGPVAETMLRFSLPFLFAYLLQTLYGTADLYIIGQFCPVESTTAVAIGSQIMHMLTVILVGLAMGTVVVIGQTVGAARRDQLPAAVGSTITLFTGIALAATGILFLLAEPIVQLMSTPEAAVPQAIVYLQISFLGIPFITAYNVISAMCRGAGDSKSPLCFVAVACVVNIALDYIFIGVCGLGAAGAALGTILSQAASVGISIGMLGRRPENIRLTRRDFRPEPQVMQQLLRIGGPVAVQDGLIQVSFLAITVFANLRGLEDAAAVGIVEKIIGMLFLVPSAMLQTVSTMAAQNIGAGKPSRARKILWCACGLTVFWGLTAVAGVQIWAEQLLRLFAEDPRTIFLGGQYLRGYVWDCVFAGIHFAFSGYFCACGRSELSFLHNVVSIVCVRLPLSYLAARCFTDTLLPMGMASAAGSALSVLICLAAYWVLKKQSPLHEA